MFKISRIAIVLFSSWSLLSEALNWGSSSGAQDIFSISAIENEVRNVLRSKTKPDPPPYQKPARMARYVTHYSDWTSMATISSRDPISGFPFANVFSVSDGTSLEEASGVPYLFLTPLEMSVKDLKENSKASLTMSLAQGKYCERKNLDPEDPRCAHIILTGRIVPVPINSTEEEFARKALFSRHPAMTTWPKDHGWFFAKMDIASVIVLDFFGGAKHVEVEDYFKATPF